MGSGESEVGKREREGVGWVIAGKVREVAASWSDEGEKVTPEQLEQLEQRKRFTDSPINRFTDH